jgi:hypothetical protein
MWVLTVDQQGSRVVGDRVELLLGALGGFAAGPATAARPATRPGPAAGPATATGIVRPFERTVGDEVQAVVDDPTTVVALALHILRLGSWTVGIGAGSVDEPLPESTRAGSGAAFIHARAAVEAAKSRMRAVPLAVRGADHDAASEAEGVLVLIGAAAARRSQAGWAVIDALTAGRTGVRQDDVATRLGITQQAVSQRLRTALWSEELAARPAAARLLSLACGQREDHDTVRTSERP